MYTVKRVMHDGGRKMQNEINRATEDFISGKAEQVKSNNMIAKSDYEKKNVKRGLRNADGTGVLAGVTKVCNVQGYYVQDGEKMPMNGKLIYRGINMQRIVEGVIRENRFGYEETAYLLLFGELPNKEQLTEFNKILSEMREMPTRFTEDMILPAPSRDIMNKLERSVLALYSYDPDPEPTTLEKELRQALQLIARCPVIVAHAYAAKRYYFDKQSLYLHRPQAGMSLAENFLCSIRPDNKFTPEEAHLLDLCLVVHAEHGGGNNSAFSCRVLSSTGTDIYSSVAAAVGSLKGPRHGGANKKVMEMFTHIERDIKDWEDDDEISAYLRKIIRREAGDGSGLVYGMGHAIYTMSDPRAVTLKSVAKKLAEKKGMLEEFELFERVERLTPDIFREEKGIDKAMCANVDMYSSLVYKMLGIPQELYTPLFAMARIVGWCAHRIEEMYNQNKIIRPAYSVVAPRREFVPLEKR